MNLPVPSRPLATLMLIVTTTIWGFAFVAQKTAMDSMGPFTFAAARYLLGTACVLPFALAEWRARSPRLTRTQWRRIGVLCLAFVMGSLLQQVGLTVTTATNGGFLTSLYVVFVPLIALFVARLKPHPIVWIAMPMALVGVFLLNGASLSGFNLGDGLMVLCAGFWAVQVFMLGTLARETGLPITLSALSFAACGLVALFGAPIFEAPSLDQLAAGWVEIAYAGVLSTALGFSLQAVGQQQVPPANAAIILSSESLFAALGGALLLGERLVLIGYLGAALIFLAIVAVEALPLLRRRHRPVIEAS